jgi:hypothetical protein
MWPNDVDYLARKERQQELLREAEREQLAQQANSEAKDGQGLRQAAGWIGNQMVKLGTKLQDYGTGSPKKDESER